MCTFCKIGDEPIDGFVSFFDRAESFDTFEFFFRQENTMHGELRLFSLLFEGYRNVKTVRVVFHVAIVLIDEPLRLHDFDVAHAVGKIDATRAVQHEAPQAAGRPPKTEPGPERIEFGSGKDMRKPAPRAVPGPGRGAGAKPAKAKPATGQMDLFAT